MCINDYIKELNRQHQIDGAKEHAYRPALGELLGKLLPHLTATNDPVRRECGAPDYVLSKNKIPVAFIETKDIGDRDLLGRKENKEQFDRYKNALDNIVFTDYLEFLFFRKGDFLESISIAELKGKNIAPLKSNFEKFLSLIAAFGNAAPQKIISSTNLAQIMARKARLMAEVIEKALSKGDKGSSLSGEMEAFREALIHDITPKEFADLYAQTIAYGMFAARLHDKASDTFGRKEAAELIPKTNPFLRRLFQNIAGFGLDERISWIVDDLAEAFRATDIQSVMKGFGQYTQQTDPVIHFYENFLSAYDSQLRKKRGVWYTPQPVVNFIVRAIDDLLQKEFGLPDGLADTSTTEIKIDGYGKKKVPKVQILDPATGNGTFLAETVRQIHEKFKEQPSLWQSYVEQHLIPRLNGFEILMAPYAMAHLKLDFLLSETGYKPGNKQRLRIYLTNSLEEYHPGTGTLFAQFLANESKESNAVKRDTPVMVVMGNPPYAVSSSNKGQWINTLLDDYKKGLNERNIQPLSDDYIKFIRYGQHFIAKNGEGILAYISNNSFIDGLIHRQMRKSLIETFDKIYILDLHGNSNRKETAPDGTKDENVFDIQQGVSINIFVKTGAKTKSKTKTAKVFHIDLYGKREKKYEFLQANNLNSAQWREISLEDDSCFFVPKDFGFKDEYETGFKIDELFPINSSGVKTHDDKNLVNFSSFDKNNQLYAYRPFDIRNINYDLKKIVRHRYSVMKHFIAGQNIGLVASRQAITDNWSHIQVTSEMADARIHYSNKGIPVSCPLYLYADCGSTAKPVRMPNLNDEIVQKISDHIGLAFEAEKSNSKSKFAPIDLLDYIYAMLHSPSYRKKYIEFLKMDFPRVPYPSNATEFHSLAALGSELRRLHLMKHPALKKLTSKYPIVGNGINTVEGLRWEPIKDGSMGKVWINADQSFDNVPLTVWNISIGGYQPAQKWLKDRKGRTLDFDEITHYQRVLMALTMTDEIMKKIDSCLCSAYSE
jgi:predicted helicase